MDRRWLTFLVLLALLAGASGLIVLLQGSGDEDPKLALQRTVAANGLPELLVTMAGDRNEPEDADGAETVGFVCSDAGGEIVVQARHDWPLETDSELPAPHIHQPATEQELERIRTCRLTGTTVPLRGRLRPAS